MLIKLLIKTLAALISILVLFYAIRDFKKSDKGKYLFIAIILLIIVLIGDII